MAGVPRRRAPRGGRRLGLSLDVGPPARDLRAVGAADPRGLDRRSRRPPRSRSGSGSGSWSGRTRSATRASPRSSRRRSTTSARAGRSSASAARGSSGSTTAFGIEAWGSGFGERLDRLDESVGIMRRLLDGERFSHEGRFYRLDDALCEPRPIQAHLPILIGGSGPKKTLRTTAATRRRLEHVGDDRRGPRQARHPARPLRRRRPGLRRHRADRQLPDHPPRRRGRRRGGLRGDARQQRHADMGNVPTLLGGPELVADGLAPFADLGFSTVIVRLAGAVRPARRSTGCPRWPSVLGRRRRRVADGAARRLPRRWRRRGEAGPRAAGPSRRSADRRRQHRATTSSATGSS